MSVKVQQHRTRDACSGVWNTELPHLPARQTIYQIQRTKTSRKHLRQADTCCTTASTKDVTANPRLQLQHQIPTWRNDGTGRYFEPVVNPENNAEIELDLRIDGIDPVIDDQECKTIALINFPPHQRQLLLDETTQDHLLNELQSIVHAVWPDNIKELPTDIRLHWSFRDELAMESGVLFKGRQILIPQSTQKEILQQLHQRHQGVKKARRLARDTVYWVNINPCIAVICQSCHACQENQVINTKEPLMPHTPPTRPWP